MIDVETLDRTNLFDGINDAARRELATRSTLRHFAKDEVLWTAGSEPRGLFVILEGSVRVVRETAGRHSVIHTEGPNGTLGEVPLFEGTTLPATAIASEATECVCITAAALDAAIQADTGVARIFLGRLASRVRGLVDRVERLSAHSVRRRLAAFLLERDQLAGGGRGGEGGGRGGEFSLGRSQAAVAEELGTVREVLVRSLRELRESGLIDSAGRGRWSVADRDALTSLAVDDR